MKIAYLGKIQLSDTDLPYLHEAQKISDITYILEINPRFNKGPAFLLDAVSAKIGVFKAIDLYPDFIKYKDFIDINKFYVANTGGAFWQIKIFWTNVMLLLFLIRRKFDVIHFTWPPSLYEWVLYLLRKDTILTVHDPFPHSGLDTFYVRLRRKLAFRFISKFIILNKAQLRPFIEYYGFDESQVVSCKLSCCTYLTYIQPDMSLLPETDKFILFNGSISRYKGLDYLLPAMKKVHELMPDVKLVIAGRGDFHFDISPYQSLNYIELRHRFIPDTELAALIQQSMFVVCPYTDATQSGVIMSAFAFNKPVIATNVGGLPEMVQNGRYGLIVREKDVDALAEGIMSLLKDKRKIEAFAENIAADYSLGEKSWAWIARQITAEYGTTEK